MPKIYLYAEVLTHLRQLTLHASLQTEKNEQTKIDVSSDKKIITLIHDGESSSLYLPTQISGTAKVTFPSEKKTELSTRVQIDDVEQWKDADATGAEAPWNASDLSSTTSLRCSNCNAAIVSSKTVSAWKDLPNQNWAELMDLWFCHKPHEHNDDEHQKEAARMKGFSAQSKLISQPGIGLVDMVSFSLHPDDCEAVKITKPDSKDSLRPTPVQCSQCDLDIGVFSAHDNLIRLDKSTVSARTASDEPFVSYPPTIFISAQLLELIEATAIRKVIAYCPAIEQTETKNTTSPSHVGCKANPNSISSGVKPLLLWVFNPDIYYSSSHLASDLNTDNRNRLSSSSSSSLLPHRASKILYRPLPPSEPLSSFLSPPQSHSHEPLVLSPRSLSSLTQTLQKSTSLLPSRARTFSIPSSAASNNNRPNEPPWYVGLLDRWERHPTAEKVMASNPLARRLDAANEGVIAKDGRPVVTRWEVPLPRGAEGLFD